ncbi:MAG: Holliday junction ATP-dependent DNA helicase RuvA [Candidatus Yanofskybacteria bacterium GW2011_GWA1_48_10]|uniref:Holliday junction branch migration complex subunit RuvA n=3 Tax=Parcubacteria group TaxID=1794811 RepID=A0A0G1X6N5_9BACT|nr:MAG: Holliday junction ATP-dependent DNA helicase RuvA [Candidatus Nomurabacteria bacterium GW2011_GWB1_47_6]KKU90055.1 MAG: Holliday junction ATP-dependent DNA helicase RuvA [Candidatus Yanofskybacteria bacterium GW2011_GWA1_48_10]
MISFIEGTIEHSDDKSVTLNAGGIGYRVIVSPRVLNMVANWKPSVKTAGNPESVEGKPVIKLHVHSQMNLREGTFDLYGFDKKEDLDLFHLLTTVSGIGPKGAQNILASVEPSHLKAAVVNEDADYLKRVSSLGPKTAQRLILELKGKLDYIDAGQDGIDLSQEGQATEALLVLGYSASEAKAALKEVADGERSRTTNKPTLQERVREALKILGKK